MDTKGFNIFFQEDEEDYLDDPISLLDLEEHTVFNGSENYLKNITIEDPGYPVNISVEDYELRLQKSLSKLKELKKAKNNSGYANNNGYLLRKCRSCSIKVVDYRKFPWYYRNKFGSTNKIQYPNKDVIGEKHEEQIMIIDLTENEQVDRNDDRIQEENTNNIEKVKAYRIEFTSVDNSVDGKVGKQTYIRSSKPVLNIQNERHTKAPRSVADEATDLIISTYTRLTDKAIQKLKSNVESYENNKNISHNLGKNLLLGSKNFTETRHNLLTASKDGQKVAKVSTDNVINDCKNYSYKKKNSIKSNKLKNIYTSEQISKTKIKIKKSSLKSKDIISSKNNNKEKEDKGCTSNLNLNTTNGKQFDSLKNIVKKLNSYENQQNREQNCNQNKQERIQQSSYSYLFSPVLTKIIPETKESTSLPNQKTAPDKFYKCDKQIFSADRIIPHFHNNAFLNHSDILSKTKSNTKFPKRSKDTINNNETYKTKNRFDNKALNMGPMVMQKPNPSIHKRIHNYCIESNNFMVDNNEPHKKKYNTNGDISNISAIHSVNSSEVTYKLSVNNGIILERSTHAFPNVVKENVNTDLINQSKKNPAQEEERQRYLLPSNLLDFRNQNIFSNYSASNVINLPFN